MGGDVEEVELRGRVLAGKLRLDHLLASGSMGDVWRARHLALDKDVAVKVLRRERRPDAEVTERFIREARIASRLSHPNIVGVLDFGQEPEGPLYLAMELLSGETLYQALYERGRIPLREACYLMAQVLAALAAAHDRGILHRDIKPSNIMLVPWQDDDGNPGVQVKVCDFGLAKFSHARETIAGDKGRRRLVGTPLYMSPEQAVGEAVDKRSDIYACGVVFFEMLTGRPPFEGERAVAILMKHCAAPVPNVTSLADYIPPEVDVIVRQALEKDRTERFQDARSFRVAVQALMTLPATVAEQPSPHTKDTSYFLTPTSTGPHERVPRPGLPGVPLPPTIEANAMLNRGPETPGPWKPDGRPRTPTKAPTGNGAETPPRSDARRYRALNGKPKARSEAESMEDGGERLTRAPDPLTGLPVQSDRFEPEPAFDLDLPIERAVEAEPQTLPQRSLSSPNGVIASVPSAPTHTEELPRLEPTTSEPDSIDELLPAMRLSRDLMSSRSPVDSHFLWERYALSPHRRPPARGFWLRDSLDHHVGPLTFDELCIALRLEVLDRSLERCMVAADPRPNNWQSAPELLATVRSAAVARLEPPSLSVSGTQGWIDPTAIPSILVRASRGEMSGRIIVASTASARSVFFEVHLVEGRPSYVETNDLSLQFPTVLVDRGALAEDDIPILVSDAWMHDGSFESSARRLAGIDVEEHRAGIMRRRLRSLLKMSNGTWLIDPTFAPTERRAIAPSFLTLLPRLVREALPRSMVEAALLPHLRQPLSAHAGVSESVEVLGFTSGERTIAEELLAAPRLESALPDQEELRRAYATVAYLLVASARVPS